MGIVNVTPDSFSDGGRYWTPQEAVRRAVNMVAEGADMIDIGGESTRPGSVPLDWKDEWARLEPVFALLPEKVRRNAEVSVDTYHPETARLALDAGASIVNCVYAQPAREMAAICAKRGAGLVVPASIADSLPSLPSVSPLYIDPMVGFGTTREEDLALLRSIGALARKGRVLVGASRKRIVKKLTGENATGKNLGGSVGVALWCAAAGASVVRVHDVRETVQALKVFSALSADGPVP